MSQTIKVLAVDDSPMSRRIISEIVNSQPDMKMVATAPDPLAAESLIQKEQPDVITLDVEMPKMDGLSFLQKLMKTSPVAVIMVSSFTEAGAESTLKALEYGAIDFVQKPKAEPHARALFAHDLVHKLRIAYEARFNVRPIISNTGASRKTREVVSQDHASQRASSNPKDLILMGSSTGGTEALRYIFENLPTQMPGILVTQHMPAGFTKKFSERLDSYSKMTVTEAKEGELVLRGHVYIAPGGFQLQLGKTPNGYVCKVVSAPPVNRHCPSVEALFDSALKYDPQKILAVMLTGMGKDGAEAMAKLHRAGAFTICQDEKTSIVFGMPGAAIALGAADKVLPLQDIPYMMQRQSIGAVFSGGEALNS